MRSTNEYDDFVLSEGKTRGRITVIPFKGPRVEKSLETAFAEVAEEWGCVGQANTNSLWLLCAVSDIFWNQW